MPRHGHAVRQARVPSWSRRPLRVLRHGGRLLFCEHVAAPQGWRRWCQQRMARPWAAFADGCRCDRPTLSRIGAQLTVETVEHGRWRGMPAIVKPLVWGTAIAD